MSMLRNIISSTNVGGGDNEQPTHIITVGKNATSGTVFCGYNTSSSMIHYAAFGSLEPNAIDGNKIYGLSTAYYEINNTNTTFLSGIVFGAVIAGSNEPNALKMTRLDTNEVCIFKQKSIRDEYLSSDVEFFKYKSDIGKQIPLKLELVTV